MNQKDWYKKYHWSAELIRRHEQDIKKTALLKEINECQKHLPDANNYNGGDVYFAAPISNKHRWVKFLKITLRYETRYGTVQVYIWQFMEFEAW